MQITAYFIIVCVYCIIIFPYAKNVKTRNECKRKNIKNNIYKPVASFKYNLLHNCTEVDMISGVTERRAIPLHQLSLLYMLNIVNSFNTDYDAKFKILKL